MTADCLNCGERVELDGNVWRDLDTDSAACPQNSFGTEHEVTTKTFYDSAQVTIELTDGTRMYLFTDDDTAENIEEAIYRMTGVRMDVRT